MQAVFFYYYFIALKGPEDDCINVRYHDMHRNCGASSEWKGEGGDDALQQAKFNFTL